MSRRPHTMDSDLSRKVARQVENIQHLTRQHVLCVVLVDPEDNIEVVCPHGNERAVLQTLSEQDFRATLRLLRKFYPPRNEEFA